MAQPWEEYQAVASGPWEDFKSEQEPWKQFQPETKPASTFDISKDIPRTGEERNYQTLQALKEIGLKEVEAPAAIQTPKALATEALTPAIEVGKALGVSPQTIADAWDTISAYRGVVGMEEFDWEAAKQKLGELPTRTPTGVEKVAAGTQQAVVHALDFFTSPVGVATLGAGALPQIAQKVIAGAFTVSMAKELPNQIVELSEAVKTNDTERIARAATSLGLNATFITQGTRAVLAPKTTAAVNEITKGEPSAIQEQKATELLQDVRAQPVEVAAEVPAEIRAEALRSREQLQEAQPLGITPSPLLQKVIEYFRPREPGQTPEVRIDTEHRVPRLQPYEAEKQIASAPQGMARVPVLGKLVDARYAAQEPVDQAIIARAYSTSKGNTFAALWAETQNRFADLFPVDKDTGTFALANGERGYLSDVIEAEMAKPGSQPISEGQRSWIRNEWEPLKNDVEAMLREEGVKEVALDEGETVQVENPYFPRPAVGKQTVEEAPTSVGGGKQIPGAKPFFLKKRLYETEAEGATGKQKVIYDPDPISRVSRYISGAYRAVADKRLANDPSLGGKTAVERYQLAREQHEPALNQLTGDALVEFEAQLRENAAHPIWLKEATVNLGPAFTGKIYPIEAAQKLQRAYGESSHNWVRNAQTVTDAAKAMKLTADMSAPFTQGLAMMFRHPARWAKAASKSYVSLLKDDVVAKVLENPEYLQAAQEFTQSGGSFLRLQDFMAGAEAGKFATRLPGLGPIIERTGRAYGTFLDLAKLELWRAWGKGAPKEQWPAIAESIENTLFMGRMEQAGLNPGRALGERLMLMAPAYYRGAGGLVATAFQNGVSGKMTRQALASYASGIALTSIASYMLLGLSEEEIERRLNPSSGKFMKVPVMSGDGTNVEVGLGNILSSVVRLLGESVEYHNSDKPIDTGVEQNPYLRFLRAKAAFLPSLGISAATGRDYFGNQTTIKKSLVEAFTPLVIGQLFHNEKASIPQRLEDALFSFFGLQSYPEDKRGLFVRERESLSQSKFKKDYEALSYPQKAVVTKELQGQERFKRDDPTPKQIEAAFARDIERLTRLKAGLTDENRKRIETLGVKIPGYQNTLSVNGVTVPLTEKETERYEGILIEEYNRTIGRLNVGNLEKLPMARRQDIVDRQMALAKQRARTRLKRNVN